MRRTTYHRGLAAVLSVLLFLGLGLAVGSRQALADEPDITSDPAYQAAVGELDRIASAYSAVAQEQSSTLVELESVRGQIADNETQIAGVEERVTQTQAELGEMQRTLASHVASDYKTGGVSLLSIVLSSDSFEDAISRMYYHNVVCAHQVDEIDSVNAKRKELKAQQDELRTLQSDLRDQEASLEELYQQQTAQADEMRAQQVEASSYLNSLSAELKAALAAKDEDLLGSAQAVAEEAVAEDAAQDDGKVAAADDGTQDGAAGEVASEDAGATAAEDADAGASANTGGDATGGTNGNGGGAKPTTDTGSSSKPTNTDAGSKPNAGSTTPSTSTTTTTPTTPTPAPTSNGGAGTMQAVLNAAYSTSETEPLNNGWGCAGWVYCVFRNSGVYNKKPRCAAWYYENWCFSSNRADLQPGMVIAVSTWTGTSAGKIYGHVGIYVGNNTVRHLSAGTIREMSLDKWIKQYGTTVTPMWGWNGGIALS